MEIISAFSVFVKQVGVPVTLILAIISTAVSIWSTLKQYRLKLLSEIRLKKSSEIEADIQLMKTFAELMNTAHSRSTYQVSEKAIEMLIQPDNLRSLAITRPDLNLDQILSLAVISLPVGIASQDAAIAAVATLGKRYDVLLEPAIQGLESLSSIRGEITSKYIPALKKIQGNRKQAH